MVNRISTPLISVVIPCFNDEIVIGMTHSRLLSALGNSDDFALEIVYVDDGSSDKTLEILTALADADRRVTVVALSRNFGQQAATTAGLNYAKGDAVAIMDSDLQDPPEVIQEMIAYWRSGYDVAYGVRRDRKEGLAKRFSYAAFYKILSKLSVIQIPEDSGDFSLIDRGVVDVLNALPERNRFIRGLRAWCGFRQIGVPYSRDARAAGVSQYSLLKSVKLAMDGFFNFTVRPLAIITSLGMFSSILAFFLIVFSLVHWAVGFEIFGYSPSDAPGYLSTILCILFFGGIQLLSIGVLGEYIGRLYEEAKDRPVYVPAKISFSQYK